MTKENKFRNIIEQLSKMSGTFSLLEAKPRNFGCRHMLHYVEVHLIEAIECASRANVTDLSQQLGVTKGAVSQKISKLCKMDLVCKKKDQGDQRNVSISLTKEGRKVFNEHKKFHHTFFKLFAEKNKNLSIQELNDFEKKLEQMKNTIKELIN
jgi:MarR family transcriptional regulator, teicoplanin-associated locus regulator